MKITKKCWWMTLKFKQKWASSTDTVLVEINTYSQNHVKCSRPLCSLPGLQGQKIDAIINFLILFKSISDKSWYDQLFINEVVKIFTFQYDKSVTKFYIVKDFWILMKFSYKLWSNIINFFWWAWEKNLLQSIFQEEEKTKKLSFLASIT